MQDTVQLWARLGGTFSEDLKSNPREMGLGLEGRVGFKEVKVFAVVDGKLGCGVEMDGCGPGR